MAEIQLRNLSKRWGSFVGVDKFDLTIPDKEFLVLLGPSGCGKTTTMRMIAGLEQASEGDILIDGHIINHLEPKDRDIAMVFQSYALYPNISEHLDFINSNNLNNIKFLYRELDQYSWQYCNKGFFNFKNYIPKIISIFN